jgi:hypothetical protein
MLNLVANGPSGYNLTNSLRFRQSASAYLSRTPASATNQKTWTWSGWFKRGALSSGTTSQILLGVYYTATDSTSFYINIVSDQINIGTQATDLRISTQVLRDPSAWYHIVVALDTTQATASNRLRVYLNGSEVTSWATNTTITQNANYGINIAQEHDIGRRSQGASLGYYDGYLTEVNFIDGQALTPSSFGSTNATTGVWQPAKYTGTYGTNGFYLNFNSIALTSGSNTGLGKDNSGNGNYWNTNNISVTAGTTYDAMIDVPTLTSATVANYATFNPVNNLSAATVSSANLNITSSANWKALFATIGMTTGKFYCEVTDITTGGGFFFGIATASNISQGKFTDNNYIGKFADDYGLRINDYGSGSSNNEGYSTNASFTTLGTTQPAGGTVYGLAVDLDNRKIYWSRNNTWYNSASPSAGTNGISITATVEYFIGASPQTPEVVAINFGQRPFTYTPPTGFVALNTYNLPTPTILQGNKYMDATLYTGTGATLNVTNAAGFKPDFVWGKDRAQAQSHLLFDSVRGVYNFLSSNSTSAESTNSTTLTAFNSNGFQLGTNATLNQSGISFVGWQWQAGQGSSSSNTNGSITSTVSVNTTAGFSVVTYTGTGVAGNKTIGHGLGVAPSMIILKDRDTASSGGPGALGANDWFVWHSSFANVNSILGLNSTVATQTTAGFWGASVPSSTVFGINGTLASLNESGDRYLAYCWAEIAGFSKFGSYTGNGSADGPFVYLGFRPKFILFKVTSEANGWVIYDTSRDTYNYMGSQLYPNLSNAEAVSSSYAIDATANGFKIRTSNGVINVSSGTFIYAAFAENPFKNALAR